MWTFVQLLKDQRPPHSSWPHVRVRVVITTSRRACLGRRGPEVSLWRVSAGARLLLRSCPQFISCSCPRNALPPLASSLAHEAVSQLLQTDLSEFRKLPRQEVEDNEEEEEKTPVTCECSLSEPQT